MVPVRCTWHTALTNNKLRSLQNMGIERTTTTAAAAPLPVMRNIVKVRDNISFVSTGEIDQSDEHDVVVAV